MRVPVPAFTVISDALLAGGAADSNWLVHGGDYWNRRFSALAQIGRDNVASLVPVWVHQTGIAESFVTTPLVVDGAMYLTTPESHVVALNAATGERLWEYIPELTTTLLCCGPENQGVAIYGNRVFVATVDGRVIALDHQSGAPVWETPLADPKEGYSQSVAPLAAAGKVFVGVGGSEYGTRGFVAALDAERGEVLWRWYTVAAPGDSANGWQGEWKTTDPFGTPLERDILAEQRLAERHQEGWKRGGGAIRTTPAYDPATGLLYVSVGGPAPSLDGVVRPGDNRHTGSIVALEAESGNLRWDFQYLPHDLWDLSGGSPPFLFEAGGRKLLGWAGKTGWVYIVDATNGQPVIRSDNFVPQTNLFAHPDEKGIRMIPGANGGNPGAPVAFSEQTGLLYIPALHQPMVFARAYQPWEKGRLWLGGSFRLIPEEPQWGVLSAVDPLNGQIRWQRQVPMPMSGGALTTAGGLVFVGQGTGTFDAFDAETGQLLWQFNTGAGVSGSPITYQIDGVQYLAVASGGHYQLDTPRGDAVFVFTLFEKRPRLPLSGYPEPKYQRGGPAIYGAARQVPAAKVDAAGTGTRPAEPPPSNR
jgi:PQQ-dependent dehydrogenase (methanol/ethanol family)